VGHKEDNSIHVEGHIHVLQYASLVKNLKVTEFVGMSKCPSREILGITVYRESFAKENVCDIRDFWCIREHFLAELHVRNESYIYI